VSIARERGGYHEVRVEDVHDALHTYIPPASPPRAPLNGTAAAAAAAAAAAGDSDSGALDLVMPPAARPKAPLNGSGAAAAAAAAAATAAAAAAAAAVAADGDGDSDIGALDLVLCADTFIYVGALERCFTLARRALRPGGLFAFSTEALEPHAHADGSSSGSSSSGGGGGGAAAACGATALSSEGAPDAAALPHAHTSSGASGSGGSAATAACSGSSAECAAAADPGHTCGADAEGRSGAADSVSTLRADVAGAACGYKLLRSGRYAHSGGYIAACAAAAGGLREVSRRAVTLLQDALNKPQRTQHATPSNKPAAAPLLMLQQDLTSRPYRLRVRLRCCCWRCATCANATISSHTRRQRINARRAVRLTARFAARAACRSRSELSRSQHRTAGSMLAMMTAGTRRSRALQQQQQQRVARRQRRMPATLGSAQTCAPQLLRVFLPSGATTTATPSSVRRILLLSLGSAYDVTRLFVLRRARLSPPLLPGAAAAAGAGVVIPASPVPPLPPLPPPPAPPPLLPLPFPASSAVFGVAFSTAATRLAPALAAVTAWRAPPPALLPPPPPPPPAASSIVLSSGSENSCRLSFGEFAAGGLLKAPGAAAAAAAAAPPSPSSAAAAARWCCAVAAAASCCALDSSRRVCSSSRSSCCTLTLRSREHSDCLVAVSRAVLSCAASLAFSAFNDPQPRRHANRSEPEHDIVGSTGQLRFWILGNIREDSHAGLGLKVRAGLRSRHSQLRNLENIKEDLHLSLGLKAGLDSVSGIRSCLGQAPGLQ
ncbi:hypothetical protein JKP88DRAFT_253691, partial [Tribonema minus]